MANNDLALYAAHLGFWGAFGATRWLVRARSIETALSEPNTATATSEATGRFSRTVLAIHLLAFGVLYFGIGNAVLGQRVPAWFPGQRLAGAAVIAAGAALACWALIWFRSWRFRAKLDAGHQLATGGPFQLVRHPIYLALNLLALGSALWVPTPTLWLSVALMVVGSDLRGRAEEQLLTATFGDAYRSYSARTRRFLPGVY